MISTPLRTLSLLLLFPPPPQEDEDEEDPRRRTLEIAPSRPPSISCPWASRDRDPLSTSGGGGRTWKHGRLTINDGDDGTGFGENHRGEGWRGRTGKDAHVEDVDVKADGEGINLLSSYHVYGDEYGDGFGDENYGRVGRDRPCASA